MKIEFHFDGVEATEEEVNQMREKLADLEKLVVEEPAVLDVYLIDDAGRQSKDGMDQRVELSLVFGKEKIFVDDSAEAHMKAFALAYHRFKRLIEEYHARAVDARQ